MDVRQLELFLAVLDCESVTGAAAQVHLSPGAVSQQVHNLAANLQTELFVKAGRKLVPTPAALRLAEHARILVRHLGAIQQEFALDPLADTNPFHFATGVTTLKHSLRRPLRRLRKRFPNADLRVTVSSTEEMVSGLINRRYDLALISLPYPEDRLEILPLFDEELLILRPSAIKVEGWHVGTAKPSELKTAQFLLYPPNRNLRTVMEGFFAQLGFKPKVIMEADDTDAIRSLVESGFGYSILPEYALRRSPRYFHPLRLPDNRIIRQQALAIGQTPFPRPLIRVVARFLQAEIIAEEKRTGSTP